MLKLQSGKKRQKCLNTTRPGNTGMTFVLVLLIRYDKCRHHKQQKSSRICCRLLVSKTKTLHVKHLFLDWKMTRPIFRQNQSTEPLDSFYFPALEIFEGKRTRIPAMPRLAELNFGSAPAQFDSFLKHTRRVWRVPVWVALLSWVYTCPQNKTLLFYRRNALQTPFHNPPSSSSRVSLCSMFTPETTFITTSRASVFREVIHNHSLIHFS